MKTAFFTTLALAGSLTVASASEVDRKTGEAGVKAGSATLTPTVLDAKIHRMRHQVLGATQFHPEVNLDAEIITTLQAAKEHKIPVPSLPLFDDVDPARALAVLAHADAVESFSVNVVPFLKDHFEALLKALSAMKGLRSLGLHGKINEPMHADQFARLVNAAPQAMHMFVNDDVADDKCLAAAGPRFATLTSLTLSRGAFSGVDRKVFHTDAGLKAIAPHLGKVQSLNLWGNFTDDGIIAVAPHIGSVTSLTMCMGLNDKGFEAVMKHCVSLTDLAVRWPDISRAKFMAVPDAFNHLKSFEFRISTNSYYRQNDLGWSAYSPQDKTAFTNKGIKLDLHFS